MAAPVLVLRPPRGVHHRAAVLRHHHRGDPGLQPCRSWLHHADIRDAVHRGTLGRCGRTMYATGAVLLPFFSFMTFLIAVPTGIKFFNWTFTMWKGQLTFETPMLFSAGFLVTFLAGGLTGDSGQPAAGLPRYRPYRGRALPLRAVRHHRVRHLRGIYFWFPKMTGRLLDERLGKLHFWLTFIGFPHHVPGTALAGRRGACRPLRRLPAHRWVHHAQHRLDDRRSSSCRRFRSPGTCSRAGVTASR